MASNVLQHENCFLLEEGALEEKVERTDEKNYHKCEEDQSQEVGFDCNENALFGGCYESVKNEGNFC